MSNQSSHQQTPTRIVLANRPRLLRELLQQALEHSGDNGGPSFEVVQVKDAVPAMDALQSVDWLIVDEETAQNGIKAGAAHSQLNVLSLEGRGHRLQYLADAKAAEWQSLSTTPSLDDLVAILAEGVPQLEQQA